MIEKPGPWAKPEKSAEAPREVVRGRVDRLFRDLKQNRIPDPDGRLSAMCAYAQYFVDHPFAEMHQSFTVQPRWGLQVQTDTALDLAAWAKPTGPEETFTPDDLRTAAAEIHELIPELRFIFVEDRTAGTFSYTATLSS